MKHHGIVFGVLILSSIFTDISAGIFGKKKPKHNAEMTIFIHGTIKPAHITFASLIRIMRDKIDNTLYSLASEFIRKDPFFYDIQPMQAPGLVKVSTSEDVENKNAAQIIASMHSLQKKYWGLSTQNDLYYTFGWNGLLSDRKRFEDAKVLYEELGYELEKLAAEKIYPNITIIAYSHGANVALYLPAARDADTIMKVKPFTIDKLILLAAPIQKETDFFVADPMFKSVYSIYSIEDSIQVLDVFSSRQLFSQRKFISRRGFKVPEKLQQIRVRITKEIKWRHHAENLKNAHEILAHPRVKLVHKDPGHTEMFNFKWGSYWYRDTFPLKPFPVVSIIPTLIATMDQLCPHNEIIFDYAPEENAFMLKNKQYNFKKTFTFLTPEKQKELWKIAVDAEPKGCSNDAQDEHVAQALQKAKNQLIKEKRYRKPRNKDLAYATQVNPAKPHYRLASADR